MYKQKKSLREKATYANDPTYRYWKKQQVKALWQKKKEAKLQAKVGVEPNDDIKRTNR